MFEIVQRSPEPAAVVWGQVPLAELPAFFGRAFSSVIAVVQAQGVGIAGEPFGFYPRVPTETVEVAAGFPVERAVEQSGDVVPMELPGGRAVVAVHVGPYETMVQTYQELLAWVAAEGLVLQAGMWEVYLSDPSAEPDPSTWRTRIVCPVDT